VVPLSPAQQSTNSKHACWLVCVCIVGLLIVACFVWLQVLPTGSLILWTESI